MPLPPIMQTCSEKDIVQLKTSLSHFIPPTVCECAVGLSTDTVVFG